MRQNLHLPNNEYVDLCQVQFGRAGGEPQVQIMKPLEHPDSTSLREAQGWLEIGLVADALAELDRISPQHQNRPEVLEVRWSIAAKQKNWGLCQKISDQIIAMQPEDPGGWIKKAVSLHGEQRYQEAWDTLAPVSARFPEVKHITYDLACYACLLGRVDEARRLLAKVFTGEDAPIWKAMAMADPDLQTLWPEISGSS